MQSKKIIYDSHELFTEIPELINRPTVKKIWLEIEKSIVPKLKNCHTVSDSIANFYFNKYNTNFLTIRNLPIAKNIILGNFPFDTNGQKIILYQGAVNKGRGIELMLESMKYLKNYIFVIIGTGDVFEDVKLQASKLISQKKAYFFGKLPPLEMQKLTPLADIGISFEEDLGLNYRYALPNKIFDYLHAGVPVLVSNLPEMHKIVNEYKFGETIKNRNPQVIAKQIEAFSFKKNSTEIINAKNKLNWRSEEEKLISLYQNAK
ncbi:MAG: glycosyltransferase [Polaribacter sp.]|nr:glycosyltransferase [Polaribacter sp.]